MTSSPTIKWLGNLTSVFFKNAPVATVVVVLLTLFSQIAMMLATLLPLKVVMLLGSEGVPRFFPESLLEIDRNTLVLYLVALSVASYIANLIFIKISEITTERGVKNLLDKTQKIILFENQDFIASSAYTKYTIALAGLIFFIATIFIFSIFYEEVAYISITFLVFSYVITYSLYNSRSNFEARIRDNASTVTNSISNIGFLLIFIYIVIDFLYLTPPHFLVALAAIILGRLMLVRLSFTASYLISLKKDEAKINALFFHNHVFMPASKTHHQDVWGLLTTDSINDWLPLVLQEATSLSHFDKADIKWRQCGLYNIIVLQVSVQNKNFIIKIFDERVVTQALHESTLMVEIDDTNFPCPQFLLATKIINYHCHIYDITGQKFLEGKQASSGIDCIQEQLLAIPPSDELVERYRRSKAFLWERLDNSMLDRLKLIFRQHKSIIQKLENALPEIKSILQSLPLSFVHNKLNNSVLLTNAQDQVVNFHWSAWTIEPAGVGHTFRDVKAMKMKKAIQIASELRPQLKDFAIEYYEIAALTASFEQRFQRQQYEAVVELIPEILSKLGDTESDNP
jgi:hypothetical protein